MFLTFQFLWSSKFTIRGTDDTVTHWKMKLYPKGDTPEASGYLSVYLSNQTEQVRCSQSSMM